MEDDKKDNNDVIDIAAVREKKQNLLENSAFKIFPYDFDDAGIGVVEDQEKPIVMFIPAMGELTGVQMSADDAEELGLALIQAAGNLKYLIIQEDHPEPDKEGA